MADYKDTLNLPKTSFPMKANLAKREPDMLQQWQDMQLYQKIRQKFKGREKFILNDGPPYANGDIHIGHAVNKIIKDIIVKSKSFSGYDSPYIPGWDCHGLPIELQVEKKTGKVGENIDAAQFRQKCREYAAVQIDKQREGFIRLGVFGDWYNPYLTMDYKFEADIIRALNKIVQNGHLHKGSKPVHWCVNCASSLAEAEVEYKNKQSPSIDVGMQIKDLVDLSTRIGLNVTETTYLVIWTTTPWTLPANKAAALHPEIDYSLVKVNIASKATNIIVATELLAKVLERYGATEHKVLASFVGAKLENLSLKHPISEDTVPVILGKHVTLDAGTGCVHTAPAHGLEDYQAGLKYNLTAESPVNAQGCFVDSVEHFAGQFIFKANEQIIDFLAKQGNLFASGSLEHSYPHCWRHKTPVIFRATPQWFISMEKNQLRQQSLGCIKQVNWVPDWGQDRIYGMVDKRPDWCISRQRYWGVPLPLLVHKDTNELHPASHAIMDKVANLVEQQGVDAWYTVNLTDLLDADEVESYSKVTDILDVWFDSGVVHHCVLQQREELAFPADLYLEGSDQHRGWFQSSLLSSVAMQGVAPYKGVITHGFTVDAEGRKMSKSLGNVVAPKKVVDTLGADVLRLWVAATEYRSEMSVSDEILKRTSDAYRRIRNTAKFLLSNIDDFTKENVVAFADMLAIDQWIVKAAEKLQAEIIHAYNNYQFHLIYQKLHNFCVVELGGFYLDIVKDRQYTLQQNSLPRRSGQTAMYIIIQALARWIAPILSFTAEEIYAHFKDRQQESIFLHEWFNEFPAGGLANLEDSSYKLWQSLLKLKTLANKCMESLRTAGKIGSSLDAELTVYVDNELYHSLAFLSEELRFVLISSEAKLENLAEHHSLIDSAAEVEGLGKVLIEVVASRHNKCERCWHKRADVGSNAEHASLCGRCITNVTAGGEVRKYA